MREMRLSRVRYVEMRIICIGYATIREICLSCIKYAEMHAICIGYAEVRVIFVYIEMHVIFISSSLGS